MIAAIALIACSLGVARVHAQHAPAPPASPGTGVEEAIPSVRDGRAAEPGANGAAPNDESVNHTGARGGTERSDASVDADAEATAATEAVPSTAPTAADAIGDLRSRSRPVAFWQRAFSFGGIFVLLF
ncbi:MAG: hypothetical protein AAF938_04245, partial [Myxococcota bacterium]